MAVPSVPVIVVIRRVAAAVPVEVAIENPAAVFIDVLRSASPPQQPVQGFERLRPYRPPLYLSVLPLSLIHISEPTRPY